MKKRSSYTVNETLQFSVFTESQCQEIHNATLEVMACVGAVFHDEDALALLKKAGAFVDGNRVRFPAGLVEWAIRTSPSRVVLCDRNGGRKVFLEDHKTYSGPGPTNTYTLDPLTGEKRFPQISNTLRASKVIDALPNIDFQMDLGTPRDVPTGCLTSTSSRPCSPTPPSRLSTGAIAPRTTRPWWTCAWPLPGACRISRAIRLSAYIRSRVRLSSIRLKRSRRRCSWLAATFRASIPPPRAAGGTAPVTLAGNIVVSNAECLAGLVVCQLVREGAPFIMGGVPSILDMRSMILSYGAPEFDLLHAGFTDLAHYYKIPMFSTAGCTDSKAVDEQAAIEATSSIMAAALSGANLIHDCGYMEYGATGSLELLVMDDEIIGHVRRVVEGIKVDEETLAIDVIKEVGPGAQFLTHPHTFEHFRKETWMPSLINRQRYDHWREDGSPTLRQRVNARVREIIENYEPEKLAPDVQARIRGIVEHAR